MRMKILRVLILTLLPVLLFCGWTAGSDTDVVLLSPEPGSVVNTLTPLFAWDAADNNEKFTVQVALDRSYQQMVVNATNLSGFNYQVPPGMLNRSTYYWRVGKGPLARIAWSPSWPFTVSQSAQGTIVVNATLDGQPWNGNVDCSITGVGTTATCSMVPEQYAPWPAGTYSLIYHGYGPQGAMMSNVSPSATQVLSDGGSIYFTLNFTRVQQQGNISIYATLDGNPITTAIDVSLLGPYNETIYNVPTTKYNLPNGTYSVSYNFGGPNYATFSSISPGPSQNLGAAGSISFTIELRTSAPAGGNYPAQPAAVGQPSYSKPVPPPPGVQPVQVNPRAAPPVSARPGGAAQTQPMPPVVQPIQPPGSGR